MFKRRHTAFLILFGALSVVAGPNAAENIRASKESFNPSLNDKIEICYFLKRGDVTWLRVYDPDAGLVQTIVSGEKRPKGENCAEWDGRDLDGEVVPNEAYYFHVETASGEVYDPSVSSGGIVGDVTSVTASPESGTFIYKLPTASRVLVRLGIRNGPMHKTLVDWKPRVAGEITEYWDGQDESDVLDLRALAGFTALVTYVALPDASVIAFGNDKETYRDYKLGRAKGRSRKPTRAIEEQSTFLRPVGLVPPAWQRAPQVSLFFPEQETGASKMPRIEGDSVIVRVDVNASDRDVLLKDRFEIMFYVDNVFFAEAERGHLPFNWLWELHQVPPGDHVFTVNVSSVRGQVGVASRRVNLIRVDDKKRAGIDQ